MKLLTLALCFLSFSTFAINLDVETLENNLEELSYSLDEQTCSTIYNDITEAHFNVGKLAGAIEMIEELKPNTDLTEYKAQLRKAKIQLVKINSEYKQICVK